MTDDNVLVLVDPALDALLVGKTEEGVGPNVIYSAL